MGQCLKAEADWTRRDWTRRKKAKVSTIEEQAVVDDYPVLSHVLHSQLTCHARRPRCNALQTTLTNKLPSVISEREFPTWEWKKYDKAFACAWVNDAHIIVGTKCNHLLCINVFNSKITEIPLPPKPDRPAELTTRSNSYGNCGVHSIQINPSGTLLATGGDEASDCQVFRIDGAENGNGVLMPQFKPVQTLVGHQDWIFGCAWLSDEVLATGSRDRTVKLWSTGRGGPSVNMQPLLTSTAHKGKVRDVQFCRDINRMATLGTDAKLNLWDANLRLLKTITLEHERELVCIALAREVMAVGSQNHVTLLDPRQRRAQIANIESVDLGQGVRSLAFRDHLLSTGSGRGCISFYDMRTHRYLPLSPPAAEADFYAPPPPPSALPPRPRPHHPRTYLKAGAGWLCHNNIYMEHFTGQVIHNACYAHAWDASGTKMFACGGPLAYGLKGCYMALWD